jgi:hypothetical protein
LAASSAASCASHAASPAATEPAGGGSSPAGEPTRAAPSGAASASWDGGKFLSGSGGGATAPAAAGSDPGCGASAAAGCGCRPLNVRSIVDRCVCGPSRRVLSTNAAARPLQCGDPDTKLATSLQHKSSQLA